MSVKVRVVFEVMGWPAEALNPSLNETVKMLINSKWKILKEELAEPEKISDKMYSSFIEFEAEAPTLYDLFVFSLTFAPTSIEILSPSEFDMTAGELQDILSDICAKIQGMDKEIKIVASQNRVLINKLSGKEHVKEPETSPDNNE
jgi:hypothetical protein